MTFTNTTAVLPIVTDEANAEIGDNMAVPTPATPTVITPTVSPAPAMTDYTEGMDPEDCAPPTEAELETFRHACTDTSAEGGWTLVAQKPLCNVWMAPSPASDVLRVRVDGSTACADIPPEIIWEIATNSRHYPKWDNSMIDFDVLQQLDVVSEGNDKITAENTQLQLTYYSVKTPMPLSNRDWTLRRVIYDTPEERMVISRTATLPSVPPLPRFVRARTIMTGFYIRPASDGRGGSSVVYYTHSEFGGSVPTRLVNWVAKVLAATIVDKLYQACKELMQEKEREKEAAAKSQCPPALIPMLAASDQD